MDSKTEKSNLELLKEKKEWEKSLAHKLASLILLEYPREISPETAVIKFESVEDKHSLEALENLLNPKRSNRLIKKNVKSYVFYFDDIKVELFNKLDMELIYAPFLLENKCSVYFDFFNLRMIKNIIENFNNKES